MRQEPGSVVQCKAITGRVSCDVARLSRLAFILFNQLALHSIAARRYTNTDRTSTSIRQFMAGRYHESVLRGLAAVKRPPSVMHCKCILLHK